MNRLEALLEYRSRLVNDLGSRVDQFIAEGRPVEKANDCATYMTTVGKRINLINAEVDKLMENQLQHV